MTMSRQSELDRYWRAVPHIPALPARLEEFVAFLWQIAPIWPVLPTSPAYKSFAVNKTSVARHLHTVEVAGSNPAAPTSIRALRRFVPVDGTSWDSRIAAVSAGRPGQPGRRRNAVHDGDVLEAAIRFVPNL